MSETFVMGRRYKPNRFTVGDVRSFWDSVADKYAHEGRSLKEAHFQRFQRAFAHFQPAENMRALNIWSRNGEAVDYFRRLAPGLELVNAEVSPRLIAKARERYPNETFIETDLFSLPFSDCQFDFILSLETLEHAPDPLGFLMELARVLKPGGRLVLSCPPAAAELPLRIYELFLPNHGEGPHRFLSTREVKSLLHAAGLELKLHESTLFIPVGPRLLRRLEPLVERIAAKTPLSELGIRQFFVCQRPLGAGPWQEIIRDVVETNLCTRCGTCAGACPSGVFEFREIDEACLPAAVRPEACIRCGLCTAACPGKRVSFAKVRSAAGYAPIQSEELGPIRRIRAAHARNPAVRSAGASGGVVTAMLCDLLRRGEITGAIVLDSHPHAPWRPWPRIARTREEIVHAAQSKYCVTPTNVALKEIDHDADRLAIVALPCQIHALRALERQGRRVMKNVALIIGLYCGNQLYFGATRSFLRRHGVRDLSKVAEIRYREGLWPGNVYCILKNSRWFARPKFEFNHLISFYAVERCLLCADLAAEGADISVADAWNAGDGTSRGSSLIVSRTALGESTVADLIAREVIDIDVEDIELDEALAMHAHGLDLKKTGALLRIQNLQRHGRPAPQYDLSGANPPIGRRLAEVLVSAHFRLLRTRPARWIADRIPFGLIGGAYVGARMLWKNAAAKKYKSQNNESPHKRRSSTRWWRLLGPLLLAVMLWRIGPEKCWSAVSGADFFWFLTACLLSIPSIAVKGLRWQWMLKAVGFTCSFGESTGVYAAGMLAGAVTPGKVGDLAKAPLLVSRGLPLGDGVAASLLDRVFDGVVLLALGLGGVLAMPALSGRAIIAVAAVLAMGITVAATYLFRDSFAGALRVSGVGWWLVMTATTLAASAMYFASAFCCAKAVGLSLCVVDVVAGSSVAAVLALLPVSVAGIGTRDAAFIAIFAHCGIDAQQSIAFSSLILAWMLVNCVFFLAVSRLCPHDAQQPQVLTQSNGVISHEPAK
jgi:coenzyme F420 hydrogenase subunit beta